MFVINKHNGQILAHEAGAEATSLKADHLYELVESINQIEKEAHLPVDIEWAFSGDKLYILQTRPITTLN
jgi:pyruvate,water dikinase